jgi:membrane protein
MLSRDIAKRAFIGFKKDNCTDWAAALTYYGLLSLFPGAIILVSLLSLFGEGEESVETILDVVRQIVPEDVAATLEGPVRDVVESQAAGSFLGLGLVGALWSASGYIGAFMRASNAIYEVEEHRKFYILRPLQILITIVVTVLVALITLGLVVSGPVAAAIGDAVGLGETAVTVWGWVKWPLIVVIVSLMISGLYHIAPDVPHPRFRWLTLGSIVALVTWVVASALFALYVSNFGSYNKTYGSLAAAIIFLVWLWITNCAILFGAELNAEIEIERARRPLDERRAQQPGQRTAEPEPTT